MNLIVCKAFLSKKSLLDNIPMGGGQEGPVSRSSVSSPAETHSPGWHCGAGGRQLWADRSEISFKASGGGRKAGDNCPGNLLLSKMAHTT